MFIPYFFTFCIILYLVEQMASWVMFMMWQTSGLPCASRRDEERLRVGERSSGTEGFSQSPAFVSETFYTFAAMKRLLTYIIIVLVLGACTGRDRYAAMRNGLDSINTLNRNGQPFTMADVQPYVDYFDHHGNCS